MNLKQCRIENNLKQQDVADYLGCVLSVYARYEREQSCISVPALIKLSQLYHVSMERLVGIPEPHVLEITDDEAVLLDAYREADKLSKEDAVIILKRHKVELSNDERQRIRNVIENHL